MQAIGYFFAYYALWLVALLPLKVFYFFSDVLYFIVFYLIKYRRNTVFSNLKMAFPNKSELEIKKIQKAFYHHFCDFLVESLKTIHLNKRQLAKRFQFVNPELFNKYFNEGKSVVLVSGHYGNWEWMVHIQEKISHKFYAIYKPLRNKQHDQLIKKIRGKYDAVAQLIPMNDVFRQIIQFEKEKIPVIIWFLADQSPPSDYPFWTNFLNRETPFYNGPEKIARKFDFPVVYLSIIKTGRGFYKAEFKTLCENSSDTKPEEITRLVVHFLESEIKSTPENWLWSHKRWKHSKEK
jgi:KDO2-lipid IV(A) lauroyltransferase